MVALTPAESLSRIDAMWHRQGAARGGLSGIGIGGV